ncbi:hypothetical protein [Pseudomonas fontis]|uniref:Uncharacterized protein n=1 Tax=Pseudomonas fontis TaxID=2942633 RepID=A0ABT5NUG4_9PSED|nr:hypothetical protein [Pseudomonas fontis]MDD0973949.1 hypothetical protein [Pseudomonas fontis]MDD0991791.1 hypothetical protein [Pseudomonas fontis]
MITSRSQDITGFLLVIVFVLLLLIVAGDGLFVPVGYYLAVSLVAFAVALLFRPRPGFLVGVALALSVIFIVYLWVALTADHVEGLLILGQVFSLPGALLGLLLAAWKIRRRVGSSSIAALLIAAGGVLLGFLINQILVCNTLMYCGVFSLRFLL